MVRRKGILTLQAYNGFYEGKYYIQTFFLDFGTTLNNFIQSWQNNFVNNQNFYTTYLRYYTEENDEILSININLN